MPEYLPQQNAVAGLDVERYQLPVVHALPRPDGDDVGFLRLFLGRVRNHDAAGHAFLFFNPLDHDAVIEGVE